MRSESGQMLMIAIMILAFLILVVPSVTLLSKYLMINSTGGQQRGAAGRQAVDHALNYTLYRLSESTTAWNNAMNGLFIAGFHDDVSFQGSPGTTYKILCSTGNPANLLATDLKVAEGQVRVKIRVYGRQNGKPFPLRAHEAAISRRTIGVTLGSDIANGAALFISTPTYAFVMNGEQTNYSTGNLSVHWGPIVAVGGYDMTAQVINTYKFPRKFSTGAVAPRVNSYDVTPHTDNNEYWAYSALTSPFQVDESYYLRLATASVNVNPPASLTANPPGSGYFNVGVGTAVFSSNYQVNNSTTVIFVDGNAEFDNMQVDVRDGGAFIISGNLILKNRGSSGFSNGMTVYVPYSASREYVASPTTPAWPCQNMASCTIAQALSTVALGDDPVPTTAYRIFGNQIQYRGFLYVKGDLIVNSGTTWDVDDGKWDIIGSVRVDGQLKIYDEDSLRIFYDEKVNHLIQMASLSVQVDRDQDIPLY